MTLLEYKTKIRHYRGALKSMDDNLDELYENATKELLEYSLARKTIGIHKMSIIAIEANSDTQKNLVVWLMSEKRNKIEIDIKLLEIIWVLD